MNFQEIQEYLFNHYSEIGFKKVVVNNDTTWMLKDENIQEAYINLTNKDQSLKLELYNVSASFQLEDLYGITIIENINGESKILNMGDHREFINEKDDDELLEIRSKIKRDIFITTETTTDLEIDKRIEVISAQRIYGVNIIKDIFAQIRDIVGGRINSLETVLNDAHQDIVMELKEKAYQFGGDGVIGLKIDHTYNNANTGSILSVFATGTVIKLKKEKI